MGVSGLVLSHAARPVVLAQACVAAAFGLLFYRLYLSPLRRIPGPFLAALTDVWRLLMVLRGRPQEEQLELHCKYGPVVRLGPNVISFADPQAIIDIYSGKHRFRKVGTNFALTYIKRVCRLVDSQISISCSVAYVQVGPSAPSSAPPTKMLTPNFDGVQLMLTHFQRW